MNKLCIGVWYKLGLFPPQQMFRWRFNLALPTIRNLSKLEVSPLVVRGLLVYSELDIQISAELSSCRCLIGDKYFMYAVTRYPWFEKIVYLGNRTVSSWMCKKKLRCCGPSCLHFAAILFLPYFSFFAKTHKRQVSHNMFMRRVKIDPVFLEYTHFWKCSGLSSVILARLVKYLRCFTYNSRKEQNNIHCTKLLPTRTLVCVVGCWNIKVNVFN
jgi:hypothetical protein